LFFHPPLQSNRTRTCRSVRLGGRALTAPHTNACTVRPLARYVTRAVPAFTASRTPDAFTSSRSEARAVGTARANSPETATMSRRRPMLSGQGTVAEITRTSDRLIILNVDFQ